MAYQAERATHTSTPHLAARREVLRSAPHCSPLHEDSPMALIVTSKLKLISSCSDLKFLSYLYCHLETERCSHRLVGS